MTGPLESVMLRTLLGPLVAGLQLFALYVVVHGHDSPGGGFQGGALFAASLILPLLVRGPKPWRECVLVSEKGAVAMAALGVLLYSAIGTVSVALGKPMLDYGALPLAGVEVPMRRSLGILGIEVGVTLAVAGAVISIFYLLYDFHEQEER